MRIKLAILVLLGSSLTVQATTLVQQGEYLARVGDCSACHTAPGGKPFSGGLALETPIGVIYSTNITPDKRTGIGDYSYEEFKQAVQRGIAKDGQSLFPAMPFPSYAKITDNDMRALYSYFQQGVAPVEQQNKTTQIPWLLNMRWPLTVWRWLFSPAVKHTPSQQKSDSAIDRGRYLVEGLGHCGACHTPRGLFMQERALSNDVSGHFLAGAKNPIDGWIAGNLRADSPDGLANWSQQDLVEFLRYGRNNHAAAFGGMTTVITDSLQYLSTTDISAIAQYLKTLSATKPVNALVDDKTTARALWLGDDSAVGASVYLDNCAACHKTNGEGYTRFYPALKGNSVVATADATSLIHIVLSGATLPAVKGAPSAITMPAFGWRLQDKQVADVVNFIRNSWGNHAEMQVTTKQVAELRASALIKGSTGNIDIDKLLPQSNRVNR